MKLHFIKTSKFKNFTISIRFRNTLDNVEVSKRALLSLVLLKCCEKYPTTRDLSRYLEELYGMRLGSTVNIKGNTHTIIINSSTINEKHLPSSDNLIEKQVQLLKELIFNCYFVNGKFDEDVVNEKKRQAKEQILSLIDDKISYTLKGTQKMLKHRLEIMPYGTLEEIEAITSENLTEYYHEMIKGDLVDIYVVGNFDEKEITRLIETNLPFNKNEKVIDNFKQYENNDRIEDVIEEMNINQAKICLAYSANIDRENYYAISYMFDAIFGSYSHSLLFREIREKHNLCYQILSLYDIYNGISYVLAGIDNQNIEKVKQLVNEIITQIQQGDFSDELLEKSRTMMISSFYKTTDSIEGLIAQDYLNVLMNTNKTVDDLIKEVNQVSKEDIINFSKTLKYECMFALKGNNNGDN